MNNSTSSQAWRFPSDAEGSQDLVNFAWIEQNCGISKRTLFRYRTTDEHLAHTGKLLVFPNNQTMTRKCWVASFMKNFRRMTSGRAA